MLGLSSLLAEPASVLGSQESVNPAQQQQLEERQQQEEEEEEEEEQEQRQPEQQGPTDDDDALLPRPFSPTPSDKTFLSLDQQTLQPGELRAVRASSSTPPTIGSCTKGDPGPLVIRRGVVSEAPTREASLAVPPGRARALEWPGATPPAERSLAMTIPTTTPWETYLQRASSRLAAATSHRVVTPATQPTTETLRADIDHWRLRAMPHKGSALDVVLHRADAYLHGVASFQSVVETSDPAAARGADIMLRAFGAILTHLAPTPKDGVARLLRFSDEAGAIVSRIARHSQSHQERPVIRELLLQTLMTLTDLTLETLDTLRSLTRRQPTDGWAPEMEPPVQGLVHKLLGLEAQIALQVWRVTADSVGDTDIETIRRWLAASKERRTLPACASGDDLPLLWLSELLRRFWQGEDSVLLITAAAGTGKTLLVPAMLDRARWAHMQQPKTLHVEVNPPGGPLGSSGVVKALLLQLFDQSVGEASFFQTLCDAYRDTTRDDGGDPTASEEQLWTILADEAVRQPSDLLIVIDGLDQLDGGPTAVEQLHARLHTVVSQRRNLRAMILSSSSPSPGPRGCLHFPIPAGALNRDILVFLEQAIRRSSVLATLTSLDRSMLQQRLRDRAVATFLEAHLILGYLELHAADIGRAARSIPRSVPMLLDNLIKALDLTQPATVRILSWVLVGQQPITLALVRSLDLGGSRADLQAFLQTVGRGLLELRRGTVCFSHPSVRQRFMELQSQSESHSRSTGTVLNPAAAHRQVLVHCLQHIQQQLQGLPEPPVALDPVTGEGLRQLETKVAQDELLAYALRYYRLHTETSRRLGWPADVADLKVVYPDSTLLAQWEHLHETSVDAHQTALQLRQALFVRRGQSVVQSLLAVAAHSKQVTRVLAVLADAWRQAGRIYGPDVTLCVQIAQRYSGVFFSQEYAGPRGDDEPSDDARHIFEYLWMRGQGDQSPIDDHALRHGQWLVDWYRRRGRDEDTARILRQLHPACVLRYGQFDPRTLPWTGQLVEVLVRLGRREESMRLCEDMASGAEIALPAWDDRRLDALFRLTGMYLQRGQATRAEERLRSSWTALRELIMAPQPDAQVATALVDITLQLGQLLARRQAADEARELAAEMWTLFDAQQVFEDQLCGRLRSFAEGYVDLGLHDAVVGILSRLRTQQLQRRHELDDASRQELVRITIALSRCYRHQPDVGSDEPILLDALELVLGTRRVEPYAVDLVTELLQLYIREHNLDAAIKTSQDVLVLVWPALLDLGPLAEPGHLPEDGGQAESAIQLAFLYARVMLDHGSDKAEDTVHLCRRIYSSLSQSLAIDSAHLYRAADLLSQALQRVHATEEAVHLWQSLRSICVHSYGAGHAQTMLYGRALVGVCRQLDAGSDMAEAALLEIIQAGVVSSDDGQGSPWFAAVAALIARLTAHGQPGETRRWHQTLWDAIKGHSHGDLDPTVIFAAFDEYSGFLLTQKHHLAALSLARELRAVLQSCPARIACLGADLRLARLLEMDETRFREAVAIYEEILALAPDEFDDREAILRLVQTATDRLAVLYASHHELAERAETVLVDAWLLARKTRGPSDAASLTTLTRLVEFYRKQRRVGGSPTALQRLEEHIVDLLIQEHDTETLFQLGGQFAQLYLTLQSPSQGVTVAQELRAELAARNSSSSSSYTGVWRVDQSRHWSIDHRCLVFLTTLEQQLLAPSAGPPRLSDLLPRLLTEISLYAAWSSVQRIQAPLQALMVATARLFSFLRADNRGLQSQSIRDDSWAAFKASVLPDGSPPPVIVSQLFEVCLGEMGKPKPGIALVERLCEASIALYEQANPSGSLQLLVWVRDYFTGHQSWFDQSRLARLGFELARNFERITAGMPPTPSMLPAVQEVQTVVSEIMISLLRPRSSPGEIELRDISLPQLDVILRILGQSQDLGMLERVFQALWDARTSHTWDPATTVTIGCRLCEAKFARGARTDALSLIEDLCYNLRDVHGPVNALTIRCESLRARFLNSSGQADVALGIHAGLIRDAVDAGPQRLDLDLPAILTDQMQRLKAAFDLNGGWVGHEPGNDEQQRLRALLDEVFDEHLSTHEDGRILGRPDGWQPLQSDSSPVHSQGDKFGCWQAPSSWQISDPAV